MISVSSVRLAAPKPATGEIIRERLLTVILKNTHKITYIHAGAGFGKTTLLSQVANSKGNSVWVTLDGESDVYTFLNIFCDAIRQKFEKYDFSPSEYLPFEGKNNFITILANAFISSLERINENFTVILDDLHTIEEEQVRKLIACILKYKPENIHFCLSSREIPWQEFIAMRARGNFLELNQKELAFTKEETFCFLGFEEQNIYNITEGWPLAVSSYKLLLENGVSISDVTAYGNQVLYTYLFYECINRLPGETTHFLKDTACFDELDPQMLDHILSKKNTKDLLDNLVGQNIFTSRIDNGYYRYHKLFRDFLMEHADQGQVTLLLCKAAGYYFGIKQYSKASSYAIQANDKIMLKKVILAGYKEYIKKGYFNDLMIWFNMLGDDCSSCRELLIAKGAFLSSIGNFTEAKKCLDMAIPALKESDRELYIEAMVHKARVLRNYVSFEESNKILDELLSGDICLKPEFMYSVVIEKIYNYCWDSNIKDAYDLTCKMIGTCASEGNTKVKAWFERYLSVIHFLAGRMKDAVYYYEKSLFIPEEELRYLDMHSVDIYVAKAYQMLGERDKAVSIITGELQKLRSKGRYEELWLGYLFAAEIHYKNSFIDRMNGGGQTFEGTIKYFKLADEYAPLYRKTEFQARWSKMQHHVYGLMFTDVSKEKIINEIYANLDLVGDYFKTIALARLFSYFGSVSDFKSAVECAKLSIEIGERAGMMMIPTMAYGILARAAIATNDQTQSFALTKRFIKLCYDNGMFEYFKMRQAYDPVLEFAVKNNIEPEITKQMMEFAGLKTKKVYITTLGRFTVFPYNDRSEPIKMRTKKERELLAFLLDAGSEGVTKEQIYQALWYDSSSDDIKKLIGVNLAQLKKDLAGLGVDNAVINRGKHYSICRDEITTDIDLLENAAAEYRLHNSKESAQSILSLYKGEYLAEFEALWAVKKRIEYENIYQDMLKTEVAT